MTEIRVLWKRIEVAAIVDGFSRRIVAMRAFSNRPMSNDLAKVLAESTDDSGGPPRFLVTDHASQFRHLFRVAIQAGGITHVRCQVWTWQLNAKVEWAFRDLKAWARRTALTFSKSALQARLDAYRDWHNRFRPHADHDTLTPIEAEQRVPPVEAVIFRRKGVVEPRIRLHRRGVRGDSRLAYPAIRVSQHPPRAAKGGAQTPGPPQRRQQEQGGSRLSPRHPIESREKRRGSEPCCASCHPSSSPSTRCQRRRRGRRN